MEDLIEALQILLKYGNPTYPTDCRDEVLTIMEIDPEKVSAEDIGRLGVLGFHVSSEGAFQSFFYGSA